MNYPEGHKLGMKVPKGGSSCAKCYWLSEDKKHCTSTYFQKWNKEANKPEDPTKLPFPADEYCCDLYTLPEGTSLEDILKSGKIIQEVDMS